MVFLTLRASGRIAFAVRSFARTLCVRARPSNSFVDQAAKGELSHASRSIPAPTGCVPKAQGCEARATLGYRRIARSTPTGLWRIRFLFERSAVALLRQPCPQVYVAISVSAHA